MRDLYLSAKFADYLREIGLLEPLVNALKIYREKQNFPFELKDKRIIKQALAKPYADLMGKLVEKGTNKVNLKKNFLDLKNFIMEEVIKDAERVYGKEKPKTVGEEVVEKSEKTKEEIPIIEE